MSSVEAMAARPSVPRCNESLSSSDSDNRRNIVFREDAKADRGCRLLLFHDRVATQPRINSSRILGQSTAQSDDPADAKLKNLGEAGRQIAEARKEVFSIFETDNSCSGWYAGSRTDARDVFRSLGYQVDRHGAGEILKAPAPSGDLVFLHPYVARVGQNVSPGSVVTLNGNGAFFRRNASLRVLATAGGYGDIEGRRVIIVGPYAGGTIRAQVLTLLHEFGHVLDLLPSDAGIPNGPEISTRNTETVLRHCKAQIDASARHVHPARGSVLFSSLKSNP